MSGVRIEHDAWVLVGDGEKALVFRNEGDADYPNLQVIRILEHENPVTREQGTDAPGRYIDGLGPNRSAVENTDWHTLEKHRFAKTMADALYKAAHKGKFSKLVVVAPPMTLGDLRKEFHKEVKDRIIAEVDKTLTGHTPDAIEKILTTKA
ncbi:host attachment protein [Polymorphum gilvum]|uniref:Protein required for attachment to host cells-like protein n=1 Tax=Polymorphum gilvum (strain LMG 25793 / CGMCC 1.9160 / SL003B-26A1) TaxID=991905 RepID=F2J0E2_POLGS|nr:host attachment family protein [Polymorphum gilvum]ADZ68676.1 Protein required for attachment to host cells-like protein [Polymorphum gilvum SL003B-26A1]